MGQKTASQNELIPFPLSEEEEVFATLYEPLANRKFSCLFPLLQISRRLVAEKTVAGANIKNF